MDQMCHTGNRTSVHKENLHLQTKPLYSTSCYFDSPAFQACMTHYAHSLPDQSTSKWETMREHENLVAKYCRKFLERIDPTLAPWGDLLGKWHDLGKYSNEFQTYLHKANNKLDQLDDAHRADVGGKVDHSTAAAQLAVEKFETKGRLLAYCFAGHHAGLPNWDDGVSQTGLKQRLAKKVPRWKVNSPEALLSQAFPGLPNISTPQPDHAKQASFRVAFWLRMTFSTLVDADFLATEKFMSPMRAATRPGKAKSLKSMQGALEKQMAEFEKSATASPVNQIRKEVSDNCLSKSTLPPGFFSLAVPTGGGKTLASLRFALSHAIKHHKQRVIFAVPFTSIIEQNAEVYRNLFSEVGDDVILEHHSNLDPENETTTNRLQTENWDAPLVVTTNVQFFESLFDCRTSRCRKLHRVANSVIILDEAQTLPIELLEPTLYALRELVDTFGCSVVLCSATQPALNWRDDFPIGIKNIQPIVEDSHELYQSLARTQVRLAGKIEDDELVEQLIDRPQVLCIVNTRNHASELYERLIEHDERGCFHLSTRMCALHRMEKLDQIRKRLKAGDPCRVVSTQLIEAGVDVDFPVVYRVSCGLDSLAQAAGRCNREGLLDSGEVVFFDAAKLPPVGFLRQSADSAKELLDDFVDDLLSPSAIEAYFQLHYWKKSDAWDKHDVLGAIGNQPDKLQFNFRQVAERYRFIRDDSETLLVAYGSTGEQIISELHKPAEHIHRNTWRRLQRYAVQVRQHEMQTLKAAGAVELFHERWVLTQSHLYDSGLGLTLNRADGVLPVEDCIF